MKKRALVLGLVGILAMSGLSFAATNNSTISKSKAEKIAMAKVPNGEIERVYLDKEDSEYNIFIKKGNAIYEVEVNARNGKVTDVDKEYIKTSSSNNTQKNNVNKRKNDISESKAREVILKKIPNGKIERIYLDRDDNEYNAIVTKGSAVYEVEVNSLNGKITDIDRDDDYYEDDYYDYDDHDDHDDDDYYDED